MCLRTIYQLMTLVLMGANQVHASTPQNDDKDIVNYLLHPNPKGVFDDELYEMVLDTQLCDRQLKAMMLGIDPLQIIFLDASARIPSGIFTGNLFHLGNYFQCLNIDRHRGELHIQGKYCTILIPMDEPIWKVTVPIPPEILGNRTSVSLIPAMPARNVTYALLGDDIHQLPSNMSHLRPKMLMAVCVPKPCTASQALEFYGSQGLFLLPNPYEEYFCRLPNDKLFRNVDYGVLGLFSSIIFVTFLSTSYDLYNRFKLRKETPSVFYRSFSIYTNSRSLTSFTTSDNYISCMDGLRAISVMWVIFAHGYVIYLCSYVQNAIDIIKSFKSYRSIMLTGAPVAVDTFFTLSGLVVTYTTLRKIKKEHFIKSIPLIYLNRAMRVFPLLWIMMLVTMSFLPHLSDGPNYHFVAREASSCRKNWLFTFLDIQNLIEITKMCLPHSWYLAVDMQLYLLSPLLLIFFYRSRRCACAALFVGILLSFVASSYYSYAYNLRASMGRFNENSEPLEYFTLYYQNTLPRSPPYLIGMAFGYALHQWQGKKCYIPKIYVFIFWSIAIVFLLMGVMPTWFFAQWQFKNQDYENFYNAFNRGLWALGLGWIIFACVHGYGGPVNWLLSFGVWKLPARISFAMYMVHMTVLITEAGSSTTTAYFSTGLIYYRFAAVFAISMVAAFFLTLLIDTPCSVLKSQILRKLKFEKRENEAATLGNRISEVPATDI